MTSKLYLTKRRNGYYYIGFFEENHRKWKTTKCSTKSDALQFLRTFEGAKKETERTPLLSELFTRFETMRGNSIRPSTMTNYRLAVSRFIEVCGDKTIDHYKLSDLERKGQKHRTPSHGRGSLECTHQDSNLEPTD